MDSAKPHSASVITVLNLKGGVGKTHCGWLFAGVCEERGIPLLAVDLDPQGNLTSSFLPQADGKRGVESLFDPASDTDVNAVVRHTDFRHIDLLPASPLLARFDLSDQRQWQPADLQLSLLDPVAALRPLYDYILFDCPPRLSLVSFAALCASDFVIIPLEAADWGAQGVVQVTSAIHYVQENFNPRLRLLGYVASRFKRSRSYQQSYLAQLREQFGADAFDTVIPDLASFERSVIDRTPINLRPRSTPAAAIARAYFDEVERRIANVSADRSGGGEKTFGANPSLPLGLSETGQHSAALRGRQRLGGAFLIEVDRIRPDPDQPRKNLDTLDHRELTASVQRLGILQPISVRYVDAEDFYQIISGERRYQAACAAGLSEIPCWVQTPKEEEVLLRQITENWQRADLHPFELADALAALRDAFGYTQKQLAELTAKPESEVSRLLSLLKLNPAAQQDARRDNTGTVSRRHLIALAQLPSEDQQEAMIVVRERGLSAQETERMIHQQQAKVAKTVRRGAPEGQRFRFQTSEATVLVTVRKRTATNQDVLTALNEVRDTLAEGGSPSSKT